MADSAPWGNTRYFWRKLPVCFSKLWVSITQLLSLTLYGSAKHYHHQLILLRTKSLIPWDKLWPRDRQFPHWVPYISHGPEYACALWEWRLWALQIFPGSLLSRSRATQKEHLIHTGLMAHCWFITSTQRQGTEKKKGRKPFPFSHKLTCHWVTLPRNYLTPITLEENRLFISNGLRFHGSWSRGAQLHHHQDFTAQCPVACKARNDEKYRFCFSQGTNTLGCGLKESEFSYNQIYFFFLNRITDCFRVFLVSSMAPSKLCKVGCLVIQHLALWGGVPLVVKTLEKLAFFFLAEMSHADQETLSHGAAFHAAHVKRIRALNCN